MNIYKPKKREGLPRTKQPSEAYLNSGNIMTILILR